MLTLKHPIYLEVYLAWDNDPDCFQITYSQQLFSSFRIATIEEVVEHGHDFVDPGGFIDSTNQDELIELADGRYRAKWLKDPEGDELWFISEESGEQFFIV